MVSVRDALYTAMFDDELLLPLLGLTREEFLKDHIHPKLAGARVYGAGFVAWAIRHLVTKSLLQAQQQHGPLQHHRHHEYGYASLLPAAAAVGWRRLLRLTSSSSSSSNVDSSSSSSGGGFTLSSSWPWRRQHSRMQLSTDAVASSQQAAALAAALGASFAALPSAVSPVAAQQLDVDTFCVAGEALQPFAVENNGWDWVEEGRHDCQSPGCRKFGYKSVTPGAQIVFEFNSSGILSPEQLQIQGNKLSLVMLFLKQQSYAAEDGSGAVVDGMGIVRLQCERGCSCEALEVNGENTDRTAELDTVATQVGGGVDAKPQLVMTIQTWYEVGC
jgi:hypothetical protein